MKTKQLDVKSPPSTVKSPLPSTPGSSKAPAAAPPKEKTPEPLVSAEDPAHDLEEEMIAAQNLQQLLDDEPDPIIHIPDTEDPAENDDDEESRELEAATSQLQSAPEPPLTPQKPEMVKSAAVVEHARGHDVAVGHPPSSAMPSHANGRYVLLNHGLPLKIPQFYTQIPRQTLVFMYNTINPYQRNGEKCQNTNFFWEIPSEANSQPEN